MKSLKRSFDKTRSGMTLVEVILGIAILAILAVLGATALFYPRYLVVTSALEQSAIHAGSAEIERHLHDYADPVARGQFGMTGWNITDAQIDTAPPNIIRDPDSWPEVSRYLEIKTTITYRGKQVELVTYRSLEVSSSAR